MIFFVSDKPQSALYGHLSLVPYVTYFIPWRHNVCSILPQPTDLVKAQLAVLDQLDGPLYYLSGFLPLSS